MQVQMLTWENSEFPKQLKKIPKPPKQIYVLGNTKLLNTPCLAMVGSRNGTDYGEKMAKQFAQELCHYGITIVSGLALGIDSYSHEGALTGEGKTISVLPSGINHIYPSQNKLLANKIVKQNGLVISEYPPNEKAKQNYFLARNRIVCGLSLGTFVIEGAKRSGTSVTAKLTKEQGKPVFCLPSSLENGKGYTPNHLIQQGAHLVMKVEDIIQAFPEYEFRKNNRKRKRKVSQQEEDPFLNYFSDVPIHINELAEKTGKRVENLSFSLMKLQLEGKIQELPGKNFVRTDEFF